MTGPSADATSTSPSPVVVTPVAEVRTTVGRLCLELVYKHRRRYIHLALYRLQPGDPEHRSIRQSIRLPLNQYRKLLSLARRLPAAVRAINENGGGRAAPEPIDHLTDRVRELRAAGLDKAAASERALSDLFAGGASR